MFLKNIQNHLKRYVGIKYIYEWKVLIFNLTKIYALENLAQDKKRLPEAEFDHVYVWEEIEALTLPPPPTKKYNFGLYHKNLSVEPLWSICNLYNVSKHIYEFMHTSK